MMHSNPADALVGRGAATAEQRAGSTADADRTAAGVVLICQLLIAVHGPAVQCRLMRTGGTHRATG